MQLLVFFLMTFYLVVASCLFAQWLELIRQDIYLKLDQRFLAKMVLVTATVLWPFILPFSYLELLSKVKRNKENIGIVINQTNPILEQK